MNCRGLLLVALLLGSLLLTPTVNADLVLLEPATKVLEPTINDAYILKEVEVDAVVGDDKVDGFLPVVTLYRWNREEAITIRYGSEVSPVSLLSDKLTWSSDYVNCLFYTSDKDRGQFSFDFLLKYETGISELMLDLEGDEGFNWWYQPPLTEEFTEGFSEEFGVYIFVNSTHVFDAKGVVYIHRPEPGGYAVYHVSKRDNQYKTGKAFHLYPVIAVDAGGKEYALPISYALHRLIIDLRSLKGAKYPVEVDPSFGLTSIGGSYDASTNIRLRGSRYTAAEGGTITALTWHGRATAGTVDCNVGAYDSDGSNDPDALLGMGSEETITTSEQWWAHTANIAFSSGEIYLFRENSGNMGCYYDSTGERHYSAERNYGDAWPNPFVSAGSGAYEYSMYANYTTGGGPTHFERNATLSISWSGSGDRAFYGGRIGSQNFTVHANGSRSYTGGRSPNLPLSLTLSGTRQYQGARDPSLSLGFNADGARQYVGGRAASLVLNFTASATGTLNKLITEFTRGCSLALTFAADATRKLGLHRTITGAITFSFDAGYAGINRLVILVTNTLSQAVESAIVAVWGTAGTLEATGETNSTGYYDAGMVSEGNYTIMCSSENYQTSINLYTISTSELIVITLSLIEEAVYMYLPWVLITLLGCITLASPHLIQDRALRMLSYPISVILWLTAAYIWAVLQAGSSLFPITYLHLVPVLLSAAWGLTELGSSMSKRDKYERM